VPSPRHSRHKPLINGLKNRHPFDGRLMLVVSFGVIPHLNTFLRGNGELPRSFHSLRDLT
ncbi:MAG: hypothetical protein WAM07_01250, partial [Halobacillus sp.]|uniref:hypothetical protein n=1 Tax=Halobacillus sp. TaxID=56800 RepID=UPI003BAF42F6